MATLHKYYVLVEYSEHEMLWRSMTREGMVIAFPKPLETEEGIKQAMDYFRRDHADAIILWWKKLDG